MSAPNFRSGGSRPRQKTPAERSEELLAAQRLLKAQAAERRQAAADRAPAGEDRTQR